MAFNICQRLHNKAWRSYASNLQDAPQVEGIYAIGLRQPYGNFRYIYVGHSRNIQRRLQQHKYQNLAIDQFIKQQFALNNGVNVVFKWVEEPYGQCVEGQYLNCIFSKLGYWPNYNMKRGNTCM